MKLVAIFVAVAAIGAVSAQRFACGPGTITDKQSGLCVAATEKVRRDAHEATPKGYTTDDIQPGAIGVTGSKAGAKRVSVDYASGVGQAIVSAIELGYGLNREIDQNKEINDLETSITQLINDTAEKDKDAREKLEAGVKASQEAAEKTVNDALAAAEKKQSDASAAALKTMEEQTKKAADDLKKFKEETGATVSGLAAAVPAASCGNKKKDGDETDVDCGGSCGKTCAKGKKCKYTSDCSNSLCMSGECNSCKSKTGTVSIKAGINAYCKSGSLWPASNFQYIRFNTCGKTGENGPTAADCKYEASFSPERYSLHQNEPAVNYDDGYQKFTAPIDGTYKWHVYGARGGTDNTCCSQYRNHFGYNPGNHRGANGGDGGRVVASHSVKAGTVFYIRAGQTGYDCYDTDNGMTDPSVPTKKHCIYNPSGYGGWDNGKAWNDPAARHMGFGACGGFNGGGPSICNHNPGGASGGGASDVRMCKQGGDCDTLPGLKQRFIVGAGGGGGSCEGNDDHGCNAHSRWGGHGGGNDGEHGYNNGREGYGGSQSRGGRHREENNKDHGSSWGTLGQGGTGGQNDAGGGGGGYYGGGGSRYNAGGGGGSNYYKGTSASGSMSTHSNSRGANRGEGEIWLEIKPTV